MSHDGTTSRKRRNPMDAAVLKGEQAALAGQPESACPYKDKRVASGRLSFSRAWRNAWVSGHRQAMFRLRQES